MLRIVGCWIGLFFAQLAYAQSVMVTMHMISAVGVLQEIGHIDFEDGPYGLLIKPELHSLPPGALAFNVHQYFSCQPGQRHGKMVAGLGAGNHYDPRLTRRHEGPYGTGHLGDLPVLQVNADGRARLPLLAPRLKVKQLAGRSIIIATHTDNYQDSPEKSGGSGDRIGCGLVHSKFLRRK